MMRLVRIIKIYKNGEDDKKLISMMRIIKIDKGGEGDKN